MTEPIPVVRQIDVQATLADRIRAGEHPVVHEARLHPSLLLSPAVTDRKGVHATVTVDVGAWRAQLELAQASIRAAIERTLTAVDVPLTEGHVAYDLHHLDHYVALIGTWRPL